jgi:hypothetical protein
MAEFEFKFPRKKTAKKKNESTGGRQKAAANQREKRES